MRHGLMACVAALVLGGCILDRPHNDVLIFGTTTKVALDVSAPVQNGALPEFTLGYKRNEGVWMPLKPNGERDSTPALDREQLAAKLTTCTQELSRDHDPDVARAVCIADIVPKDKYVSYSAGIDSSKGGKEAELDTYSVFASFGGRGGLGFNQSSGNLAQFFATGIAAQRLGANPQLAAALNSGGAEAAGKAADAEKARAEADAVIASAAAKASETETNALTAISKNWKDCADPASQNADYLAVLDIAATKENVGTWFADGIIRRAKSKEQAIAFLKTADAQKIVAFNEALAEKCPRS